MASDYNILGPEFTYYVVWNANYYSTLSTYISGTRYDTHSLKADPLFTDPTAGDFTLQAGSPAIGAGVYIPGVGTANPPNIGAK